MVNPLITGLIGGAVGVGAGLLISPKFSSSITVYEGTQDGMWNALRVLKNAGVTAGDVYLAKRNEHAAIVDIDARETAFEALKAAGIKTVLD